MYREMESVFKARFHVINSFNRSIENSFARTSAFTEFPP